MIKQRILNYTTVFESSAEGGYIVYVPALPGLVTQGDNLEESRAMVKDAIDAYLAILKEDGEEIPVESDDIFVSKIQAEAP